MPLVTYVRVRLAKLIVYAGMLWLKVGGKSAGWFCHIATRVDPDFKDHHDGGWIVARIAEDYRDGEWCAHPVGSFMGEPVGCMRRPGHDGDCTYLPTVEMIQDDAGWPADHPLRRIR